MRAPARQCQHHDIVTTRCEKHTPCQHRASRPCSLLPTLALLSCQQLHHGAQSRWYSHLDLPLLPQVTILLSTPRPATQVTTNCRDSTAHFSHFYLSAWWLVHELWLHLEPGMRSTACVHAHLQAHWHDVSCHGAHQHTLAKHNIFIVIFENCL